MGVIMGVILVSHLGGSIWRFNLGGKKGGYKFVDHNFGSNFWGPKFGGSIFFGSTF